MATTDTPAPASTPAAAPDPATPDPKATPDPAVVPEPARKDDPASPASKAPEKYELTLPDSGHLDAGDLTAIEAIARQAGWTNEEAQQRVTEHAAAVAAQSTRFEAQTKDDPVYGGTHLDDSLKYANLALDKLRPKGTPRGDALRTLLNKSGYGNHLEVVSLLADLGKAMAEDTAVGGPGGGGAESKDLASRIYSEPAAK